MQKPLFHWFNRVSEVSFSDYRIQEEKTMRATSTCVLAGVLATVSGASAGVVIDNGDMNGSIGTNTAPIGWMVAQATPDVVGASGPFNNTGVPWTESPNGGTFARMNGVGNFQSEGISQNVSGFTAGETYELSFFATNLGFRTASTGSWSGFDGYFEFYADGNLVATSDALSKQDSATDPIEWTAQSVMFEATSSEFLLEIRAETVGGELQIAYMGIDGVNAAIVPAPGALSALAMLGFAASRRRR